MLVALLYNKDLGKIKIKDEFLLDFMEDNLSLVFIM